MTRQVYREIVDAAADLGRREDIHAVIVFGGHEIFSAGDDVPELRTLNADEAEVAARVCREAVDALAAIPKPTVAAITGYALGGGLTLALAADWRVGRRQRQVRSDGDPGRAGTRGRHRAAGRRRSA